MRSETIDQGVTRADGDVMPIVGRYRIVRQLGQGGMGSVWLAEDTLLDGKQFAIKMLPSVLVANKRAYRQLKDEAIVAMKLVHPNIVQLRAFEENDGNPFLVMDYIDGQTLDDYLVEHGGTLPEPEVIRILKPIAAALDYAHSKNVVHRDVKPGNVMVRTDGKPFILDFGIARKMYETMTHVTGKFSGGTLLYMSPEQLYGEVPKPAQDIYSFAAMAYECLKGEPPFSRGQVEHQIVNRQPAPLGGTRLCASIMRGLAKKPDGRPRTCEAVLGGAVFGSAVHLARATVHKPGAVERAESENNGRVGRVTRHGKEVWIAVGALALLAVAVGGIYWLTSDKPQDVENVNESQAEVPRPSAQLPSSEGPSPVAEGQSPAVAQPTPVPSSEGPSPVAEGLPPAVVPPTPVPPAEGLSPEVAKEKIRILPDDCDEVARLYRDDRLDLEDAGVQNTIGLMYLVGRGFNRDYDEGQKWLHKAAERGSLDAWINLGCMYENGIGVDKDCVEAMKWFRKAADLGNADAQYKMGCMYQNGLGVASDYDWAMKWYLRAAEKGHAVAQNNIGYMYHSGLGVKQDLVSAVKWYLKAANQGDVAAQYNIGYMFEAGHGVQQNIDTAVKWYRKAAQQGSETAKERIRNLGYSP